MATGFEATERTVLKLTGADCAQFLQDLVTNDIHRDGLVYAALLTPQGKYLFDFFVFQDGEAWFLDVLTDRAQALAQRLSMYKLRADVTIEASDMRVFQVWDTDLGFEDPRHVELGRRVYDAVVPDLDPFDGWEALRVAHVVPETGRELIADDSYILECGFERLNGVDFKKGCYVGQEVTARMKHKTELRKGLTLVELDGPAEVGSKIVAGDKDAGVLHSVSGRQGIAYLRFDRAKGEMMAGSVPVRLG